MGLSFMMLFAAILLFINVILAIFLIETRPRKKKMAQSTSTAVSFLFTLTLKKTVIKFKFYIVEM